MSWQPVIDARRAGKSTEAIGCNESIEAFKARVAKAHADNAETAAQAAAEAPPTPEYLETW